VIIIITPALVKCSLKWKVRRHLAKVRLIHYLSRDPGSHLVLDDHVDELVRILCLYLNQTPVTVRGLELEVKVVPDGPLVVVKRVGETAASGEPDFSHVWGGGGGLEERTVET